jgi:hypothetical protein
MSAPGDYDNGEIGGMIGRGNRSTRREPAPVPLCPPQTPHATIRELRAAAVGSQRLTAELRQSLVSSKSVCEAKTRRLVCDGRQPGIIQLEQKFSCRSFAGQ